MRRSIQTGRNTSRQVLNVEANAITDIGHLLEMRYRKFSFFLFLFNQKIPTAQDFRVTFKRDPKAFWSVVCGAVITIGGTLFGVSFVFGIEQLHSANPEDKTPFLLFIKPSVCSVIGENLNTL